MMPVLFASILLGMTPQLPLSIATTDKALAVFANPAGLGTNRGWELNCFYNFQRRQLLDNSTLVFAAGPMGVFIEPRPLRFGGGAGIKQDNLFFGIRFIRDSINYWDVGTLFRPAKWLSLGILWQNLNRNGGRLSAGAGLRPFGNRFTVFAESYFSPIEPFLGFQVEPIAGISISGRVKVRQIKEAQFVAGMAINLGRIGFGIVSSPRLREAGGQLRITQEWQRSVIPPMPRYLEVKIAEPVVDQKPGFSLTGGSKFRLTYHLLDLLKKAKADPAITGIVVKLEDEGLGFAQAQELRDGILDFRQSGKRLWVYAADLGMTGFYLASAADRIVLHPLGGVVIPGVAVQTIFLKGTLDKLGVKPEVYRYGKYKSAVETFTEESLSDANREQLQALVNGIYDEFISAVGSGRNISSADMDSLVGRAFFRADEAQRAGLIDIVCYEDELDSILKKEFKGGRKTPERWLVAKKEFSDRWDEPLEIAVLYASGSIIQGESGTDFFTGEQRLGATTLCELIRRVRDNKKVKGVVLRVNSSGGDGFASDLIWRELELLKKKKPLIVSMGAMAASGGYYISCGADQIFAQPTTITGSIGVFDLRLITEGLYNKLGMRRQTVKRGEHADALLNTRDLNPVEDSIFQNQVEWFYQQFVEKVAKGRNLSSLQVDSAGQGRVWLGRDAYRLRLVDSLGGLLPAIDYCQKQARLKGDYRLVFYPQPKSDWSAVLSKLLSGVLFDFLRR